MSVTNVAQFPGPRSGAGVFDAKERITKAITPELVIALCGPLGSPLHDVAGIFKDQLTIKYNYKNVEIIKLSDFIRSHGAPKSPASISDLIEAGNELRKQNGLSVLAQMAMKKIATNREMISGANASINQLKLDIGSSKEELTPAPVLRNCHIIDSIKNKEELHLLRSVYGNMLHLVSVYSPLPLRVRELERKYKKPGEVHTLIDRDSGEELDEGQSVRDIFPQADFFLRVNEGTDQQIKNSVQRYLDLLLGVKIITPTANERAMYAAFSSARNSACLSRQVGAAITDSDGEVLAVGWNDVPKPFGGLYEGGALAADRGHIDHRCWNKGGGKCFNDEEKDVIAKQLVEALLKEKIIQADQEQSAFFKLRRSSELKGLIEFSRAVHAEMHAILNAAKSAGGRVSGGKLFVTTYPCHSCARHLIAAGIKEIRFIEPYRKSLATRLHADAITESEDDISKVVILPYDGVAPRRFLDLFTESHNGRKDAAGKMRVNMPGAPVTAVTLEAITTLELIALKELESKKLLSGDSSRS